MTPQEVIKAFMQKLMNHNLKPTSYVYDDEGHIDYCMYGEKKLGAAMLDAATKASSKFNGIQDAVNHFLEDHKSAERQAIKEILGSDYKEEYAGKQLSDLTEDANVIIRASTIRSKAAVIFLNKYCGMQLNSTYYNGGVFNSDTGAITGEDANITLEAGDVIGGTVIEAGRKILEDVTYNGITFVSGTTFTTATIIDNGGTKLGTQTIIVDGHAISANETVEGGTWFNDKLIIGSGTFKDNNSIVPEYGNFYSAQTKVGQNINTGSNDWIVEGTNYDDQITSGGIDLIDAGAGNDVINVNANDATIKTGSENDVVNISNDVKRVTLTDLSAGDRLNIGGNFKIQTVRKNNDILTVTDTSGERVIKITNSSIAKDSYINSNNITITDWIAEAGFDIDFKVLVKGS